MSEVTPSGWKRTTFKSICRSLVNGGTPDTGNGKYWGGNTPWVTGADFTSSGIGEIRRYMTEAGIRSSSTNVVRAGNLLLVTRTGVGKLAIAPSDIAISQDITGIYLDENEADSGFVYFLMRQGVEDLKKRNQGTSINGIIRSDLEGYVIQIPCSLTEQKRIASILATLESVIEKTEALITKYQQIKAGLMHDLFTRGITADGKLRPPREQAPELYQETPIGWIPKEWDVAVLDQLCSIIDPQPDHRTPPEQLDGIPYIGIGDFDAFGEIDTSSCRRVFVSTFQRQKKRFSVETGDVIYGKIGTIGQPKKLSGSTFALSANVLLMKPNINKQYFLHALMTRYFEKQISDVTNTTSQPALGIEKVRKLQLPCPSSTEQMLIARHIDQTDSKLSKEFSVAQKLKKQKFGLMSDLITGNVRVND